MRRSSGASGGSSASEVMQAIFPTLRGQRVSGVDATRGGPDRRPNGGQYEPKGFLENHGSSSGRRGDRSIQPVAGDRRAERAGDGRRGQDLPAAGGFPSREDSTGSWADDVAVCLRFHAEVARSHVVDANPLLATYSVY